MSRHRLHIVLAVFISPALLIASAQARIPANMKTSATPDAYRAQIQGIVDAEVKALASDDPATQKATRVALVDDVENKNGSAPTKEYQAEYASDVAKALLPALNANGNMRFHVNVAVVVADIAAKAFQGEADLSSMVPLVQALLADKHQPAVLWGMKAARYVMGSLVLNGVNAGSLGKQVVKAMQANGTSGFIVEEAYNALTFEGCRDKLQKVPQFANDAGGIIPDLLDALAWRESQYHQAGDPPPSPQAEGPATVFLSATVYSAVAANPSTRDRTLKVMGEMTCTILHAIANGNSSPELVDIAKRFGSAFDAFGQQMQNPNLSAAGKSVAGLGSNLPPPARLEAFCGSMATALKSVGVIIHADGGPAAAQNPAPAVAGAPQ